MAGRVLLVATSVGAAAGQLTWPAWEALRSAPVHTADPSAPAALRSAGVDAVVHAAQDLLPAVVAAGGGVVLAGPGEVDLADRLRVAGLEVEVVVGSAPAPGARLLEVVAVTDRLRSPGGCPWDAAQTHASLRRHLLEEAYEAYEALEDGDLTALREELGDVLLQVVLHARLAQEAEGGWSVDDVAGDLVDKLVRRHPHVFDGASADDLEGSWDTLKAAEKRRTSVTEGVPLGQPALALAATLQRRAERLGVPVPGYDGEGGALWRLVGACRAAGAEPEEALRAVARRFRDELAAAERVARSEGRDPSALDAATWRRLWPAGVAAEA